MSVDKLLYANQQPARAIPKGASRLQETKEARKVSVVDDRTFKREIWKRDKSRCRCCERQVLKAIARIPERGDVHHLHGRIGDLLHEAKCALLVCCECHEKLTGRVAEKWIAVGTKFWHLNGERVIDARATVKFRRVT